LCAGGVQKIIHKLRNIISCSPRSAALGAGISKRKNSSTKPPNCFSPLLCVALFSCFLKTSVVLGVWLMRPAAEVGLICELECCSNNYAVSCSAGAAAAFELYIFIRVCCHAAAAVGPNQASLVISKQRSSLGRSLLFLLIKFISRMNQANKYGDAARCPA
jgi:hypothetical protein